MRDVFENKEHDNVVKIFKQYVAFISKKPKQKTVKKFSS